MRATELLHFWRSVLTGRLPFLSIEITKRCPLTCPGCYAYGEDHLGGGLHLTTVSEFQGKQLVNGVLELVDRYRPVHLSIVGGEPLVRVRELEEILPEVARRGVQMQLVTSAVRPIPATWARIEPLTIAVSVDGLPAEHNVRRKPATYERILQHILGHRIRVHCTVTRQMTRRPGYLQDFVRFWSARDEVEKIWFSVYTPQVGEMSDEIVPPEARVALLHELLQLGESYRKVEMPPEVIDALMKPPEDPRHCVFAQMTRVMTADLRTAVTPCQFGGRPDCSQCGCLASAGMTAVTRHRLPGGVPVSTLHNASMTFGRVFRRALLAAGIEHS
ncbi:MAG TPA: radical SAM protein [Terriglobia bacterium]|nr:radical SAM protein [Terriglobia bacterium]